MRRAGLADVPDLSHRAQDFRRRGDSPGPVPGPAAGSRGERIAASGLEPLLPDEVRVRRSYWISAATEMRAVPRIRHVREAIVAGARRTASRSG